MMGRLLSIAAVMLLAGTSPASSYDLPAQHAKSIAAAKELMIAEQFDRGQMSEAEYLVARAQIKSELFTALQQRFGPKRQTQCYMHLGISNCN
jgi:hypothetical protein